MRATELTRRGRIMIHCGRTLICSRAAAVPLDGVFFSGDRISQRRIEPLRTGLSTLRLTLPRTVRHRQFCGAADVFLADFRRSLPGRQGTGGLDDGQIASNAVQLVLGR